MPLRAVKHWALAPEETRFTESAREHATSNSQTYFVTSATWERRPLFRNPGWAELFLEVLHSYRGRAYLLHEYVLMPEHFHVIITPLTSLERAVQFVKGGFSFRAKKDLKSSMEVWQRGFQITASGMPKIIFDMSNIFVVIPWAEGWWKLRVIIHIALFSAEG